MDEAGAASTARGGRPSRSTTWLAFAVHESRQHSLPPDDAEGAEALYKRALEIDTPARGAYNLGYVMLRARRARSQHSLFHGAIEADPILRRLLQPSHAYEQVGETQKARPFWKNYISLEPSGTWTEDCTQTL